MISAGDVLGEINSTLHHDDEVMLMLENGPSRQSEQDCGIATSCQEGTCLHSQPICSLVSLISLIHTKPDAI